jgi:hypothetical protein
MIEGSFFAGDDFGQAAVRVAGVAMLAAGLGTLTGLGLPTAGGLLGHAIAVFAVVRGVLMSYFAPHPAAIVETVQSAAPDAIG